MQMKQTAQRTSPGLPSLLLALLLLGSSGVQTARADDDAAKLQELRRALEAPGQTETAAPPKRGRTRAIVFEAEPAPAPAAAAQGTPPAAPANSVNSASPAPVHATAVAAPAARVSKDCAALPADVRGTPVAFAIQFKVGSAELTSGSERTLAEIGKLFATLIKDRCVVVEGHTDSTGNFERNLALSRERSESVVAYLTTQSGIQRDRLLSVGKGSNDPEKNLDPRDARNRRVVFKVVD